MFEITVLEDHPLCSVFIDLDIVGGFCSAGAFVKYAAQLPLKSIDERVFPLLRRPEQDAGSTAGEYFTGRL